MKPTLNTITVLKVVLANMSATFAELWRLRAVNRSWKDTIDNYSPRLMATLLTDKVIASAIEHGLKSPLENYFYLLREHVAMPFVKDPNNGFLKAVAYKRLETIASFMKAGFDVSGKNSLGFAPAEFFLSNVRGTEEDICVAGLLFPQGSVKLDMTVYGTILAHTFTKAPFYTTKIGLKQRGSRRAYIFNKAVITKVMLDHELYDDRAEPLFKLVIENGLCVLLPGRFSPPLNRRLTYLEAELSIVPPEDDI